VHRGIRRIITPSHFHSFAVALPLKEASIVRFVILRKGRSRHGHHPSENVKLRYSPRMCNGRGGFSWPLYRNPLSHRDIIAFSRADVYLPSRNINISQKIFNLHCFTYLTRPPYFHTSLLEHHLQQWISDKLICCESHCRRTWRQCASQPTTRGTANKTGKKSSGKPGAHVEGQHRMRGLH